MDQLRLSIAALEEENKRYKQLLQHAGIPADFDPNLLGNQAKKPEDVDNKDKQPSSSPNSLFTSMAASCDSNSLMDHYGLAPLDVSLDSGGLFSLSPLPSVTSEPSSTVTTTEANLYNNNNMQSSAWSVASSQSNSCSTTGLLSVSTAPKSSEVGGVSSFTSALGEDGMLSPDFMQELVGESRPSEQNVQNANVSLPVVSQDNASITNSVGTALHDMPVTTTSSDSSLCVVTTMVESRALGQTSLPAVSIPSITKESTTVTSSVSFTAPIMTTGVVLSNATTVPPTDASYSSMGFVGPVAQQSGQSLGSLQGTLVLQANGQLLLLPSAPIPALLPGAPSASAPTVLTGTQSPAMLATRGADNANANNISASAAGANIQAGFIPPSAYIGNMQSAMTTGVQHQQPQYVGTGSGVVGNRSVTVNTPQGLVTMNTMPSQPSQLPSALILPNGQIVPVVTQPNAVFGQNCTPVTGPLLVASNSSTTSALPAISIATALQGGNVAIGVGMHATSTGTSVGYGQPSLLPLAALTSQAAAVTAKVPLPVIGQSAVLPLVGQQFKTGSVVAMQPPAAVPIAQQHSSPSAVLPPTLQAVVTPDGNIIITLPPAVTNVAKASLAPAKSSSKSKSSSSAARKSGGSNGGSGIGSVGKVSGGPRILMPKPPPNTSATNKLASNSTSTPITSTAKVTAASRTNNIIHQAPAINASSIPPSQLLSVGTSNTSDILARAAESIFSSSISPSGPSNDLMGGFYSSLHDENALQIDIGVVETDEVGNVQVHNAVVPSMESKAKPKAKPKKKTSKKSNTNSSASYLSDSAQSVLTTGHADGLSEYMAKDDFADIHAFSDLIKINDPSIVAKVHAPSRSESKDEQSSSVTEALQSVRSVPGSYVQSEAEKNSLSPGTGNSVSRQSTSTGISVNVLTVTSTISSGASLCSPLSRSSKSAESPAKSVSRLSSPNTRQESGYLSIFSPLREDSAALSSHTSVLQEISKTVYCDDSKLRVVDGSDSMDCDMGVPSQLYLSKGYASRGSVTYVSKENKEHSKELDKDVSVASSAKDKIEDDAGWNAKLFASDGESVATVASDHKNDVEKTPVKKTKNNKKRKQDAVSDTTGNVLSDNKPPAKKKKKLSAADRKAIKTNEVACVEQSEITQSVDEIVANHSADEPMKSNAKSQPAKKKAKKKKTTDTLASNSTRAEDTSSLFDSVLQDNTQVSDVEGSASKKQGKENTATKKKADKKETPAKKVSADKPEKTTNKKRASGGKNGATEEKQAAQLLASGTLPERIEFCADDLADILDQVENLGTVDFSSVDSVKKKGAKTKSSINSNNKSKKKAKKPDSDKTPLSVNVSVEPKKTVAITEKCVSPGVHHAKSVSPVRATDVPLFKELSPEPISRCASPMEPVHKEDEEMVVAIEAEKEEEPLIKEVIPEVETKKKKAGRKRKRSLAEAKADLFQSPVHVAVEVEEKDIAKKRPSRTDDEPTPPASVVVPPLIEEEVPPSPVATKAMRSGRSPKKIKSKKGKGKVDASFDVFDFDKSEETSQLLPALHNRSDSTDKRPATPEIVEPPPVSPPVKKKSPKKKKKKKRERSPSPDMPQLVVAEEYAESHRWLSNASPVQSDDENKKRFDDHLHNLSLLSETCVAQASETSRVHSPLSYHSSVAMRSPYQDALCADDDGDANDETELEVRRVAPMKVPRDVVIQPPSPINNDDRPEESNDGEAAAGQAEVAAESSRFDDNKMAAQYSGQVMAAEPLQQPVIQQNTQPLLHNTVPSAPLASQIVDDDVFEPSSSLAKTKDLPIVRDNMPSTMAQPHPSREVTREKVGHEDSRMFYSAQPRLSSCSLDRSPAVSNERTPVVAQNHQTEMRDHREGPVVNNVPPRMNDSASRSLSALSSTVPPMPQNSYGAVSDKRVENEAYSSRICSPLYSYYPPSAILPPSERLSSCQQGPVVPAPLAFPTLEKGWNTEQVTRTQYSPRDEYLTNKRARHQSPSDQPSPRGNFPLDYSSLHYPSYGHFAADGGQHYSARGYGSGKDVGGLVPPSQASHPTPVAAAVGRVSQTSTHYTPASLPSSTESFASPPLHHFGGSVKDMMRGSSCEKIPAYPPAPYGSALSSYVSCDPARLLSSYSQLSSTDRYSDGSLPHRSQMRPEEEISKSSDARKQPQQPAPSSGHANKAVGGSSSSSRRNTPHDANVASRVMDSAAASYNSSNHQSSSKSSKSSSTTKNAKKPNQPQPSQVPAAPSRYDVEAFSRALYEQQPGMSAYYHSFRPLTPPPRSLQSDATAPFFAANFFAANSSRGLPGSSPLQHKAAADIVNPFMFPQSRAQHGGLGLNFPSGFGMGQFHPGHPNSQLAAAQTAMASHFGFGNIFSEMNGCAQAEGLNLSPIKFPSQPPMDPSILSHHQSSSSSLYGSRGQMPSAAMLQNAAAAMSLFGHPHSTFDRSMPAPSMPAHFAGSAHSSFGHMPLNFAMHDH